jgi:hypothetical protein
LSRFRKNPHPLDERNLRAIPLRSPDLFLQADWDLYQAMPRAAGPESSLRCL